MKHAVPGGRSLIGMAECPYCGPALVYLGSCEVDDTIHTISVEQQVDPVAELMPRPYDCAHGPDERGHTWSTLGPIEIRPVLSLHVDVLRPVDVNGRAMAPGSPGHTTSTEPHTGAAAAPTTAGATPPPPCGSDATDIERWGHAHAPTAPAGAAAPRHGTQPVGSSGSRHRNE